MQAVQERSMRQTLDIAEIARQHYTLVYRFCSRRVGLEVAQDAAQETFLTAQRVLKNYRGESALRTWLLGIAHNECRRLARSRRLESPTIELEEIRDASLYEDRILDRHTVAEALNRLSPEHREVVLLHEVEGLSYDEAAQVIGIPPGTVKSRLHHAFAQMRRSLQDRSGGER